MNYDERIKQCTVDIQALIDHKVKLIQEREAAKTVQWKHGDIAKNAGIIILERRLFIEVLGKLLIYDMDNGRKFDITTTAQEWATNHRYVKIGNIFASEK